MRGEARMTDDAEVPGGGCGRSVGPAYTALRDGIRRFVAARVVVPPAAFAAPGGPARKRCCLWHSVHSTFAGFLSTIATITCSRIVRQVVQ